MRQHERPRTLTCRRDQVSRRRVFVIGVAQGQLLDRPPCARTTSEPMAPPNTQDAAHSCSSPPQQNIVAMLHIGAGTSVDDRNRAQGHAKQGARVDIAAVLDRQTFALPAPDQLAFVALTLRATTTSWTALLTTTSIPSAPSPAGFKPAERIARPRL
jgi:hypothetical protein